MFAKVFLCCYSRFPPKKQINKTVGINKIIQFCVYLYLFVFYYFSLPLLIFFTLSQMKHTYTRFITWLLGTFHRIRFIVSFLLFFIIFPLFIHASLEYFVLTFYQASISLFFSNYSLIFQLITHAYPQHFDLTSEGHYKVTPTLTSLLWPHDGPSWPGMGGGMGGNISN